MPYRCYGLLISACLLLISCAAPDAAGSPQGASTPQVSTLTSSGPPASCPITHPPGTPFVPPAPYPATPPSTYAGQFWYGTADLWTMLRDDGTWSDLPLGERGYGQKVFWWREGYDMVAEPNPELTVSGKRLDAPAMPLVASSATNAAADLGEAMLVLVEIPEPGCWEITGLYKGHELSFVVWVAQ
jgi:hypothetical protein